MQPQTPTPWSRIAVYASLTGLLAAAIDDADRHLYRAKRNGRSRICWEGDTDPEVIDAASWRAGPLE